jgi:hypothetical protein
VPRTRLAAPAAAVLAAEAPALVAGLRDAFAKAETELPTLEQSAEEATAEQAALDVAVAETKATLAAIPNAPAKYRERSAAEAAHNVAVQALDGATTHARFMQKKLADARAAVRLLGEKIAAIEALPAPDATVLAAIRGE